MTQFNQDKLLKYWLEASQDDLTSAKEIINKTSSYIQGLFFVHLALEKALKALFIKVHNTHAPLTHNLLSLAQKCELEFSESEFESI